MPLYRVVSRLDHNQQVYDVGTTVELTAAEGKQLMGDGVVVPEPKKKPEDPA